MNEIKLINANDIPYFRACGFGYEIELADKKRIDELPAVDDVVGPEAIDEVLDILQDRAFKFYRESVKTYPSIDGHGNMNDALDAQRMAGRAEGLEIAISVIKMMLLEEE